MTRRLISDWNVLRTEVDGYFPTGHQEVCSIDVEGSPVHTGGGCVEHRNSGAVAQVNKGFIFIHGGQCGYSTFVLVVSLIRLIDMLVECDINPVAYIILFERFLPLCPYHR